MTTQARIRRLGWIAALSICIVLYGLLHLKVNAVHAEVVRAERNIVQLEHENLLLETEFLTRSNQVQLAKLNRINFGFQAPRAEQFIDSPRQLAQFGSPRGVDAPNPIRLAGYSGDHEVAPFPKLVSPLTGEPVDSALLASAPPPEESGRLMLNVAAGERAVRVPLVALGAGLNP